MKWEIEDPDKKLLLLSGAACAAYSAAALGAPKKLHELHMEKDQLCHEPTTRWFGLSMGCDAASQIVLAASDNQKAVKDSLKVAGAAWCASAAMTAYNAQEKVQKRDVAIGTAAGMAAMGALCLWRGFREDDDDKKEA